MAASVAQEFYKLRDEWARVQKLRHWRIAVWVAEYPDVDIIDKFLEIERSPIAAFDDIFFKFESVYQGDDNIFAQQLWAEYISWFEESPNPDMDIYKALLEEGYLKEPYQPDTSLDRNITNLWKELVRFHSRIRDFDAHFCLYFPLVPYNKYSLDTWFREIINDIPVALRLVTLDFARDRRLKINDTSNLCVSLYPKLDMLNAIKNEMDKENGSFDTIDIHTRFRKQIREVMETTTDIVNNRTGKEVKKLFSLSKEINNTATEITALFVAAQAYYHIKEEKKSNSYSDQAIGKALLLMELGDPGGYEVWKGCTMMKAAMLFSKDRNEALLLYESLAGKALEHQDMYMLMEARRLMGHLYYEMGQTGTAFEYMLLSLVAGSYLETAVRRNSTFLHAAHMAVYLGESVRKEEDIRELKAQLEEWLGDDWQELLQQEGVSNAAIKQKNTFLKA